MSTATLTLKIYVLLNSPLQHKCTAKSLKGPCSIYNRPQLKKFGGFTLLTARIHFFSIPHGRLPASEGQRSLQTLRAKASDPSACLSNAVLAVWTHRGWRVQSVFRVDRPFNTRLNAQHKSQVTKRQSGPLRIMRQLVSALKTSNLT